ncbi:MAG: D-alanine--D-alanine ligase [Firmicutes bacterium]|nr:D-alanine--D-alanine ligase [Bacillota bacterium]
MGKRLKVGVLFGGQSSEHAISLLSAAAVIAAMDQSKYEIVPIGITEDGRWLAGGDPLETLREKNIPGNSFFASLITDPTNPGLILLEREGPEHKFLPLDAVFPVLHGPYGEDGTVQGLLELAGIPYVGAGVLSSAVGMDKVVMKILFQHWGLPIGDFLYFKFREWNENKKALIKEIEEKLGYPCFVKPANLGSSVGISKAADKRELIAAIEKALRYDYKIIIEAFIHGREIECSVLGDAKPIASLPGEIIPGAEFYDYHAKYIDDSSRLIIPAPLKPEVQNTIKNYAIKAFLAVECSGMGRIDFFYQEQEDKVYVNEINTIPGFTKISMYPKLWKASGISYSELIDRLIEIALEKHRLKKKLLTRYSPAGEI